jgi:ParB-like chromosome segregation protein Spo0J
MTGNGYPLDRLSPARHVASELDRAAPAALSLAELAATYRHPNPSDLARVRSVEHADDPVAWLIRQAIESLMRRGKAGTVQIEQADGAFRLAVPFSELRFEGKRLVNLHDDHAQFRAPFDPMTGQFAENIRTDKVAASKDGMEDLRESMRAFGWVPEFPALRDKRGVFLTGHRRLKVAEELGIDPVIKTLDDLGDGDEHDARRLRIALASNVGFKPLSPTDRKAIAESLYADGWVMERIGQALNVSTMQVSNDLREFKPTVNSGSNRGRPRRVLTPEKQAQVDTLVAQGVTTQTQLMAETGLPETPAKTARTIALAKQEARETTPALEQMLGLMATLADLDTVVQIRQAADDRIAELGGNRWRP